MTYAGFHSSIHPSEVSRGGVYMLEVAGEIEYVGTSCHLQERFRTHRSGKMRQTDFIFHWTPIRSDWRRFRLERELILKYHPVLNRKPGEVLMSRRGYWKDLEAWKQPRSIRKLRIEREAEEFNELLDEVRSVMRHDYGYAGKIRRISVIRFALAQAAKKAGRRPAANEHKEGK